MRLREIMIEDVHTIPPEMSADEAWALLERYEIHHLVVMDNRNAIVGVISHRDLGGDNGASIRLGRLVQDLMSSNIVTANSHTTIKEAANLLRGYHISCLPVVDDGKLKGIVTVTDLLELVGRRSNLTNDRNIRACPPLQQRRQH